MMINAKNTIGAMAFGSVFKQGIATPVRSAARDAVVDVFERAAACPATTTWTQSNTVTVTAPFTSIVKTTVRPTTTSVIDIPTWVSVTRSAATLTKTVQATVTQPITSTALSSVTQTQTAVATVTKPITVTQTQDVTSMQATTLTSVVTDVATTTGTQTLTAPGNTVTLAGKTVTAPGNTVTIPGSTVTVTGTTTETSAPTSSGSTPTSTGSSASSAPTGPAEPPLANFGGAITPAVWANEPDGAHLTVVFAGQAENNPCQRASVGEAPYQAGVSYLVATIPYSFFDQQPGGPSTEIDPGASIEMNYYWFDAQCNPGGPASLYGQANLVQEYSAYQSGLYAQMHVIDMSDLPGGTTFVSTQDTASTCAFDSPPAFLASNCDNQDL